MDQVNAGAGAITQINANFQTVNPSGMYGRKASTSSGLTWGYQGGWFTDSIQIADGTIVVGASTTTYVVADRTTGALSSSTNTTNWNNTAAYIRIAVLVSGASGITSYTDRRPSLYNNSGGGGGGGTVSTVVAGTGIDVDSSDPANPEVALDSASQASLALADSAVQPGDLATIATSGAAADVSIVDAGGYFTSTDVEGALQELGAGGGGGGMTNPMTTQGDLIVGGVSGAPGRLGIGSASQQLRVNAGGTTLEYFTPSGGGDVTGPGSSTDNTLPRFDGTTGKVIQASGVIVTDADEISAYKATIRVASGTTDTLLASDSGCIVEYTSATAVAVTLPNSLPKGWNATLVQAAAGQVTVSAGAGATLVNRYSQYKTSGQWAEVTLYVRSNSGSNAAGVLAGDTST